MVAKERVYSDVSADVAAMIGLTVMDAVDECLADDSALSDVTD